MSTALGAFLDEQERYRTIWQRTYAPLRRAIAGIWVKDQESDRFEVRFDADGGFSYSCYDSGVFLKGRYIVVPVEGEYFLAVEDTSKSRWYLKIDEVDMWRLRLTWVDGSGVSMDLSRKIPTETAARVSA